MKEKAEKRKTKERPLESPADEKFKNTEEKKSKFSRSTIKVVVANVINAILIIGVFYILGQLPDVAERIKELRSSQIASQEISDAAVIQAEIDRNAAKIAELKKLYLDDEGFIVFIEELNRLQQEGLVSSLDLTEGRTIINSDGTATLPVIIEFRGQEDQINGALERVSKLPILLKPSTVEVQTVAADEENPGGYIMSYSAFLIVDGDFAAN